MRKRARGPTLSVSDPTPQPTTTEQRTSESKLVCYFCNKGPAKELLVLGQQRIYPAFCSPACAVDFALKTVCGQYHDRCLEHNQWRDQLGKCPDCEVRFAQARNLGTVQAEPVQADEKAVDHV